MLLPRPPVAAEPAADVLCRIASEPERLDSLYARLGEFSHLVRNRLNCLQIGLYLVKGTIPNPKTVCWTEVETLYREAAHVIELFQTACRPMALRPITIGLDLVLRDFSNRWGPRFASRGATWQLSCPVADEPSRIDPTRIAQALDAYAAWRMADAGPGSEITVKGRSARGWTHITWTQTDAPVNTPRGALPLGALARVASAHGGKLIRDDPPGAGFTIEWPNRESSPRDLTPA